MGKDELEVGTTMYLSESSLTALGSWTSGSRVLSGALLVLALRHPSSFAPDLSKGMYALRSDHSWMSVQSTYNASSGNASLQPLQQRTCLAQFVTRHVSTSLARLYGVAFELELRKWRIP